MLRWSGMEWEEGPQSVASTKSSGQNDGPHGPYIQSQRLQIYQEYIKLLLEVIFYLTDTPNRDVKLIIVFVQQID